MPLSSPWDTHPCSWVKEDLSRYTTRPSHVSGRTLSLQMDADSSSTGVSDLVSTQLQAQGPMSILAWWLGTERQAWGI